MNEPTEEQIKRFWEWCGARCLKCNHLISSTIKQDMCCCHSYELDLDLNNLFKYAVPKVHKEQGQVTVESHVKGDNTWEYWASYGCGRSGLFKAEDPALALFWAIWKVIEKEVI